MDTQSGLAEPAAAGEGARPPPASEVEKSSLQRARIRLMQRISSLCGWLGQRMPVLAHNNIRGFWQALRSIGSAVKSLVWLAEHFKVSLLGDYQSLWPHWPRVNASA